MTDTGTLQRIAGAETRDELMAAAEQVAKDFRREHPVRYAWLAVVVFCRRAWVRLNHGDA